MLGAVAQSATNSGDYVWREMMALKRVKRSHKSNRLENWVKIILLDFA